MNSENKLKLFEEQSVRTHWDDKKETHRLCSGNTVGANPCVRPSMWMR